jgi:AhpD family alkylhydroperoxidase
MTAPWTIGQLARAVDVNIQTVRYYERLKLLRPSARRASGYRIYGEHEERRLRFIKNAQALGFTLQESAELRKLTPKVTGGLVRMRQEAYRDGTVAAKYKLLTAMAISIAIRCEPCIHAYVRMACDRGITQEELVEFLEVAMTMQGCPGEEWALKAYAAYKECRDGRPDSDVSDCCDHQTISESDEEVAP